MGVYLKWRQAPGSSYTRTYIYRSDSETGVYTEISNQTYDDLNYYDIGGSTSNWYKIKFYDAIADAWSDFSDAFNGGTWLGYCNIQDIRDITPLSTSDISDSVLCRLIALASQQINSDMNVYTEEEVIREIPGTYGVKLNEINGTNMIYWLRNYPIGDSNNSFTVTISDITVYEIDSTTSPSTKTELTVSSIIPNSGQFVLPTAPGSNKTLLVTYYNVPLSVSDPHALVRQATALLTAAWAYTRLNVGKSPSFKLGNTTIRRDMNSFKYYQKLYSAALLRINSRHLTDIKEALNTPLIGVYEISPPPPTRSTTDLKDGR